MRGEAEYAVEVVDLVVDETGQPAPVDRGDRGPVESGGLDDDRQGATNEAADVEEAEAAFVLFFGLRRAFDDAGLSRTIAGAPGSAGWTAAAARSIPIGGAVIPIPWAKVWTRPKSSIAMNNWSTTASTSTSTVDLAGFTYSSNVIRPVASRTSRRVCARETEHDRCRMCRTTVVP